MSCTTSAMAQWGPPSRLTADEIQAVREVYGAMLAARRERARLCHELEIPKEFFNRVGRGEAGRKPRPNND